MKTINLILILVIFGFVLSFLIVQFFKWFYKVQVKVEKSKFIQDFALLKICVECSDVNKSSFYFIQSHFNEIELNPEKDALKLHKLKKDFESKFAKYFDELDVKSELLN